MTIQRMDHVGIVVDDLAAATAFFVELGLEVLGEMPVEGEWVDRVVGLEGVRVGITRCAAEPAGPFSIGLCATARMSALRMDHSSTSGRFEALTE